AGAALVAYRSTHHPVPVIEPAMLRVRTFAWSNAAAIAFSASFAANMRLLVLWLQRVWHWSAIDTGLGVAPGPMMVPGFAVVANRLQRRLGSAAVTAIGSVLGISVMIAILGTSHTPTEALDQFRNTFWVIAAAGLVGAVLALGMTPRTQTPRTSVETA